MGLREYPAEDNRKADTQAAAQGSHWKTQYRLIKAQIG
jgi:hypothetical protein